MATYSDFIAEALEDLGYLGAETPLEAADSKKAFNILNDMLAEWSTGILPGVAPADNESDEVRAPRYSHSAIKANLAVRCSAPFRTPISAELAAVVKTTSESLLRITAKIGKVNYPGTLPRGSGNECWDEDVFYPDQNESNF